MFRDFSTLQERKIGHNHLKNLRSTLMDFSDRYDLYQKEVMFLLWAYDLEFWTLDYASENYDYSRDKLANRIVYPLMTEGFLYKYYLFREETKYNYRVRYALTQKARLMVQRFYNSLSPETA